jgi:hypothetical protein
MRGVPVIRPENVVRSRKNNDARKVMSRVAVPVEPKQVHKSDKPNDNDKQGGATGLKQGVAAVEYGGGGSQTKKGANVASSDSVFTRGVSVEEGTSSSSSGSDRGSDGGQPKQGRSTEGAIANATREEYAVSAVRVLAGPKEDEPEVTGRGAMSMSMSDAKAVVTVDNDSRRGRIQALRSSMKASFQFGKKGNPANDSSDGGLGSALGLGVPTPQLLRQCKFCKVLFKDAHRCTLK